MQVNEEDRLSPQEKNKGTNMLTIGIVAAVLIVSGVGYYYYSADSEPLPEIEIIKDVPLPAPAPKQPLVTQEKITEPEPVIEQETLVVSEPKIVTSQQAKESLPILSQSDPYIEKEIIKLADGMNVSDLIRTPNLAQQAAVFVDNFAQGDLLSNNSPIKGPSQRFTAVDINGKTYLNPDSYHRYDMYANLLSSLDPDELVATYQQMYPLFEEAFTDLGYANMDFNERVKQAIQEVLDAPIIEDPIELSSVSVNYQFVDPKLENLPAAQKLIIRMGPDNAKKIKNVLRELENQLNQE